MRLYYIVYDFYFRTIYFFYTNYVHHINILTFIFRLSKIKKKLNKITRSNKTKNNNNKSLKMKTKTFWNVHSSIKEIYSCLEYKNCNHLIRNTARKYNELYYLYIQYSCHYPQYDVGLFISLVFRNPTAAFSAWRDVSTSVLLSSSVLRVLCAVLLLYIFNRHRRFHTSWDRQSAYLHYLQNVDRKNDFTTSILPQVFRHA